MLPGFYSVHTVGGYGPLRSPGQSEDHKSQNYYLEIMKHDFNQGMWAVNVELWR